ncbi:MAG TPA: cytidine deaminase [Actinomycetota bacterium]|nr:cytidine deaminase [Actinomycetota bacterium]
MPRPTAEQLDSLLAAAHEVRGRAYAPYSGFRVGAAVLAEDGRVFPGANVENASYPLSACAERSAVQRAVSDGARKLVAVAVRGSEETPTWPCGGCRQVLYEFGPEMTVVSESDSGEREERRLADLLPDAFRGPVTGG